MSLDRDYLHSCPIYLRARSLGGHDGNPLTIIPRSVRPRDVMKLVILSSVFFFVPIAMALFK